MAVLVIGAGLAGYSVYDALVASGVPTTLLTMDTGARYSKPMLSVGVSQARTPQMLMRAGVDCVHGQLVSIDSTQKSVQLADGRVLVYDDLVLALGAHTDQNFALNINHIDGYSRLYSALDNRTASVGIVGAGMVGVELADDLRAAGHEVTLIGKPLQGLLPQEACKRVAQKMTQAGIYIVNARADEVHYADDGIGGEVLAGGVRYDFEVLVGATGLRFLPTIEGLPKHDMHGIIVDKNMQTSIPHIYAIGDCVQIDGAPCRYVAPHRAQARAIVGAIINNPALYQHTQVAWRLKSKSTKITATGDMSAPDWRVVVDDAFGLSMEGLRDGVQVATLMVV